MADVPPIAEDSVIGKESNESAEQADRAASGASNAAPSLDVGLKIFRASQPEEIIGIKDIALEFHNESRYAHIPFSEKKFIRQFSKAIASPSDTISIYITYNGKMVGLLNAGAGDYYLGEGGRMVTVYVMYVSKSIRNSFLGGKVGLKLIRMVTDWAQAQKAEELHIHSTSGVDAERTDKLLKRLGFKTYGGNYAARVA